jgi:hypothetical protein
VFFGNAALFVVVVPALVAGAVLCAAWLRTGLACGGRGWVALALGLAYIAGHCGLAWPAWPPLDVQDRLPFLALAATVLGLLESRWPGPAWTRWENRILATGMLLFFVMVPGMGENWGTKEGNLRLAAWGVSLLASSANLDALAARLSGARIVLPAMVVAAGAAAALLVSGSAVLGQLAGVLAAALGACWVVSWWKPPLSLARGGTAVLIVVLGALVLEGNVFSQLPAASAMLLACAPGAVWLGRVGPLRRLAGAKATILAAALAAVPVGLALGLALRAAPSDGY